jgi:hypothetical protein
VTIATAVRHVREAVGDRVVQRRPSAGDKCTCQRVSKHPGIARERRGRRQQGAHVVVEDECEDVVLRIARLDERDRRRDDTVAKGVHTAAAVEDVGHTLVLGATGSGWRWMAGGLNC